LKEVYGFSNSAWVRGGRCGDVELYSNMFVSKRTAHFYKTHEF
jgi:hypothetical protein